MKRIIPAIALLVLATAGCGNYPADSLTISEVHCDAHLDGTFTVHAWGTASGPVGESLHLSSSVMGAELPATCESWDGCARGLLESENTNWSSSVAVDKGQDGQVVDLTVSIPSVRVDDYDSSPALSQNASVTCQQAATPDALQDSVGCSVGGHGATALPAIFLMGLVPLGLCRRR